MQKYNTIILITRAPYNPGLLRSYASFVQQKYNLLCKWRL